MFPDTTIKYFKWHSSLNSYTHFIDRSANNFSDFCIQMAAHKMNAPLPNQLPWRTQFTGIITIEINKQNLYFQEAFSQILNFRLPAISNT